jgi:hypothetical protein
VRRRTNQPLTAPESDAPLRKRGGWQARGARRQSITEGLWHAACGWRSYGGAVREQAGGVSGAVRGAMRREGGEGVGNVPHSGFESPPARGRSIDPCAVHHPPCERRGIARHGVRRAAVAVQRGGGEQQRPDGPHRGRALHAPWPAHRPLRAHVVQHGDAHTAHQRPFVHVNATRVGHGQPAAHLPHHRHAPHIDRTTQMMFGLPCDEFGERA